MEVLLFSSQVKELFLLMPASDFIHTFPKKDDDEKTGRVGMKNDKKGVVEEKTEWVGRKIREKGWAGR